MFKKLPRHSVRLNFFIFSVAFRELFKKNFRDCNYIEKFEKEFAKYIGVKYAIAVPSCRIGIYLGLKEYGLKEDDGVIMPTYTFYAVLFALKTVGLKPVLIDIKETDYNIDENLIEDKITQRTRVILVSHMFGFPCNMDKIVNIAQRYNLILIEDVAQACGVEYKGKKLGSFGNFAVFSFGLGKNLPCFGGGMITTNDDQLYKRIKGYITKNFDFPNRFKSFIEITKSLIVYILTSNPVFSFFTFPIIFALGIFDINFFDRMCNENVNSKIFKDSICKASRFTNLQAAVGLYLLKSLDNYNKIISANAFQYDRLIKFNRNLECEQIFPKGVKSVRYYYMIKVKNRDLIRRKLLFKGIDTKADDMYNCSRGVGTPKLKEDEFPNTQQAISENIEIPNNTKLSRNDLEFISAAINKFT